MPSQKARNEAPLWGVTAKPRPLGGVSAAVYFFDAVNVLHLDGRIIGNGCAIMVND